MTPFRDGNSHSLVMCREYLGKEVTLEIDQAYGTTYKGAVYEANYGFVPGTVAPDGLGLDGYFLGPQEPLTTATGMCIAIVHRLEDDDDKLIVVEKGSQWSKEQVAQAVHFKEQHFKHEIILWNEISPKEASVAAEQQ